MRIAISGSQGVGKTTLIDKIWVDKSAENFHIEKEIVRSLMREGVSINKGADHRSQLIILEAHYKNILKYPELITDRCAIDAFAYAIWDYLKGNYSFSEHKEHESIFLSCISSYDKVFYLKPEFQLQEDGVRSTDSVYQTEIHNLFVRFFE